MLWRGLEVLSSCGRGGRVTGAGASGRVVDKDGAPLDDWLRELTCLPTACNATLKLELLISLALICDESSRDPAEVCDAGKEDECSAISTVLLQLVIFLFKSDVSNFFEKNLEKNLRVINIYIYMKALAETDVM